MSEHFGNIGKERKGLVRVYSCFKLDFFFLNVIPALSYSLSKVAEMLTRVSITVTIRIYLNLFTISMLRHECDHRKYGGWH